MKKILRYMWAKISYVLRTFNLCIVDHKRNIFFFTKKVKLCAQELLKWSWIVSDVKHNISLLCSLFRICSILACHIISCPCPCNIEVKY